MDKNQTAAKRIEEAKAALALYQLAKNSGDPATDCYREDFEAAMEVARVALEAANAEENA